MKIGAYVDAEGELTSLRKKGLLRLYEGAAQAWRPVRDIPLDISAETSLPDIRGTLDWAAKALGDCRVVLSSETRGFFYSYLEEIGVRTWQSNAPVMQALPVVEEGELERAAAASACGEARAGCSSSGCGSKGKKLVSAAIEPVAAQDLGDGRYLIDLAATLKKSPATNSRQILIPILAETPFRTLEILCDHLPRWFHQQIAELCLEAKVETLETRIVKATVTRNIASSAACSDALPG
jgi:Fe-only nitrogenase accessory protein AnfO